jgi:hypothetical protein
LGGSLLFNCDYCDAVITVIAFLDHSDGCKVGVLAAGLFLFGTGLHFGSLRNNKTFIFVQ